MSIKKLVTLSLKATYTSCKWPASYFLLRFVCNVAYLFYSVNKRNNRKCITTVAGLPGSDAELKALVKTFTSVSTPHPSWIYVLCINVSCWLYDPVRSYVRVEASLQRQHQEVKRVRQDAPISRQSSYSNLPNACGVRVCCTRSVQTSRYLTRYLRAMRSTNS